MSAVPEMVGAECGPVRVVGGRAGRMMWADEMSVGVLSAYPVCGGMGLYSLAAAIEFGCAACEQLVEATLVAVREGWLVCPGCYGSLAAGQPRTAVELGAFGPAAVPLPASSYIRSPVRAAVKRANSGVRPRQVSVGGGEITGRYRGSAR
ncbi:hypothetical protein SAMN05421630_109196 [Prauserella marina]|uniref:Uncharacterized protein n=1 Tax=Prauserella marina TaxID=530584 RepID=A0A1G6VDQ5_9PSEU|nr:hypothetical protein DES30_103411 [Prauserella marina]SDD51728.1 hypothetical protein SAMN05421630_109196 [Prauserella marina]